MYIASIYQEARIHRGGHRARESAHGGISQSPQLNKQARILSLVLHNATPLEYVSAYYAHRHGTVISLPDVAQHGGFVPPLGALI